MLNKKALAASSAVEPVFVEDVFSTYLYTGNGSTQTITNGIDLAGEGGLVWIKSRSAATSNFLFDTERGTTDEINSDTTDGEVSLANSLTAFNADGFSISSATGIGVNSATYVSWTFRKAPKFFDVVTYTGTGSNRTVAHNLGSVPGCIIVKRTDTTGDWQVYHRANTANPETDYLVLNTTAATADSDTRWNDTLPTSTVFSLGTDATVNANNGTYVAYLFAHDAGGFGEDGDQNVISCGSFTGNANVNGPSVTLGWEPQWLLIKKATGTVSTSASSWTMWDTMRGITTGGNDSVLWANLADAESTPNALQVNATGFQIVTDGSFYNESGQTYIYIAIRRGPMKTPTSGTEVFTPVVFTGADQQVTSNFPVDFALYREVDVAMSCWAMSRLTAKYALTDSTAAETSDASTKWDLSTTFRASGDGNSRKRIYEMFRRAPGFFDAVCYTGTGSATTVSHNLGAVPELMIVKQRNAVRNWAVYYGVATAYIVLNESDAAITGNSNVWESTNPTSSVFSVGTNALVNNNGGTYLAYLFASCPGVSKVGTYTGNGSNQTINCGFTAGARFVLIKRTDSTGDWVVFDSARGIVAGNDPYLLLNSNAAEVTNKDAVDTDNTGFVVNETTGPNVNTNNASYIYLAIA